MATYRVLTAVEKAVLVHWQVLAAVGHFAEGSAAARRAVLDGVPRLHAHAATLVAEYPGLPAPTAVAIGRANAAVGSVYPEEAALVPVPESTPLDGPKALDSRWFYPTGPWGASDLFRPHPGRPGHWSARPAAADSQLVRATYPWVNYHRTPVFDLAKYFVFFKFGHHYRNWTTELTLFRCQEYYRTGGPRLYVLPGLTGRRKAEAPWLTDARAAEAAFTAVGFAHKPGPARWATRFLPATTPDGVVAFAQSLVYNANPRRPAPDDAAYQPVTGWDTLNWGGAAPEWPRTMVRNMPGVTLNWQAKLVPVSRLPEAAQAAKPPFAAALSRLDPHSPLATGH